MSVPSDQCSRLRFLQRIAFSNITQRLNPDGTFKPVQAWPVEFAAAVRLFRTANRGGLDGQAEAVTRIELCDKLGALAQLVRIQELAGAHATLTSSQVRSGLPELNTLTKDQLYGQLEKMRDEIDQALRERQGSPGLVH